MRRGGVGKMAMAKKFLLKAVFSDGSTVERKSANSYTHAISIMHVPTGRIAGSVVFTKNPSAPPDWSSVFHLHPSGKQVPIYNFHGASSRDREWRSAVRSEYRAEVVKLDRVIIKSV